MGEYLPPPYGLLQLAGFLESKMPETESVLRQLKNLV